MADKLTEKYTCVFDPTPVGGHTGRRKFFAEDVNRLAEKPMGDALAFAVQCARDVWFSKDKMDPRRWLISTDNDNRASVSRMGYHYRVYDRDRSKHKMWAIVTGHGSNRFISYYGLDDEPQDQKPAKVEPTFSVPAALRSIATEQVSRFIEATAYRGPTDSIHGAKFNIGTKVGVQHRTQKASNNTLFYIWTENNMSVIGIGNHTRSNTEYEYIDENGQKKTHKF